MFLEAMDKLRAWLEILLRRHDIHKESLDEQRGQLCAALKAVHSAANRTRAYIADAFIHGHEFPGDRYRERDRERELSQSWVEVGHMLMNLRDDSARFVGERCLAKAHFWADPECYIQPSWMRDDVKYDPSAISLNGIVDTATRLIRRLMSQA